MAIEHIAMLGLGKMGSALAEQLVASDAALTVWNRSSSKCDSFRGRANVADSAAEACAQAELIVLSLSDYSASLEVLDAVAADSDLAGKRLLQLTSGTASDARTLQAWANMHDLRYLDAAIIAYPNIVGSDHAVLLYSGDEALFDELKHTVGVFGGVQRFVGESVGAAATYDCAVLEYYYGATAAMLHGAALVDSENLPLNEYFFLAKAIGPLLTATADNARDMISREQYVGNDCTLDVHVAALRHIQRMSHDNHIDTRVPDTIIQAYKKALAAGHGDDEIAATFETLRRPG